MILSNIFSHHRAIFSLTLEEEELGEEETLEGLGRGGGGGGGGGLGGREQETREHGGQGQDDGLKTEHWSWSHEESSSLTRSFMMLDISAVLRTGDRLTPDTLPLHIYRQQAPLGPRDEFVSAWGCLVQIGSSAEAAAAVLSVLRLPPSARLGAISASVRAFLKVQGAGQN